MENISPDYKKLFLEEQRRREEAERQREEAQRQREEAQRRREEEQQRREEAEQVIDTVTRKSNLPEFLNACHVYLFLGLRVQTNPNLSTKGDPANAGSKHRPDFIRPWKDFGKQQEAIWKDLMMSEFSRKRQFISTNTLRENGENVSRRLLGSETDLHIFQRIVVEDHVSRVLSELYEDQNLRRKFNLKGSISFENHSNTLSPDIGVYEAIERLSLSGNRRRSPRLQALSKPSPDPLIPSTPGMPAQGGAARSRADQFCVYNISVGEESHGIPAFIMEYKAPHKLTLDLIYQGFEEINGGDIGTLIRMYEIDDKKNQPGILVAAIITQAFSYIVNTGLEFGCVCTGEAYIFLQIPEDARTVHYFLSVPRGDAGLETGWDDLSTRGNRLHLTAVGQMIAFTLLAIRNGPRPQAWKASAIAKLKKWEIIPEMVFEKLPSDRKPSSEYRPPNTNQAFFRASPIQLRRRRQLTQASCREAEELSDTSGDSEPGSPSNRMQRFSAAQRAAQSNERSPNSESGGVSISEFHFEEYSYCTQACLRGLVEGGPLDKSCPNATAHGTRKHKIDRRAFLRLVKEQITQDPDYNIDNLRIHGARGVMFCIRLTSHGYTVAAKGTTSELSPYLLHEASVYDRLQPIQGKHIPVHLGNIDLVNPYFYDGNIMLSHMMFMSYGGVPLHRYVTAENKESAQQKVAEAICAVHGLSVLHNDAALRNLLWNAQTQSVTVIDFERATKYPSRKPLGEMSANRKRKRQDDQKAMQKNKQALLIAQEAERAVCELNRWSWSFRSSF